MATILHITSNTLTVSLDDNSLKEFPISSCSGFVPAVGMTVRVSMNGDTAIIQRFYREDEAIKPEGEHSTGSNSVTYPKTPHRVNKIAYIILAFFLGGFGIHKFYSGHAMAGIIYLLLCWTFISGFLAIIDIILALLKTSDKDGNIVV